MLLKVALFVLLSSLIAAVPARAESAAAGPADFAITDGAAAASLPLDRDALADDQLIVPVSIDGQGPFPFDFDSGGHTLIDATLAQKLGLALEPDDARYWGTGGWFTVQDTTVARLAIGHAELRDQAALVRPIDDYPPDSDVRVRGIVGAEVLERFVAIVDYAAGTVTLVLPNLLEPAADSVVLPIDFPVYKDSRDTTPMVAAWIDGVEGWFLIDTGDSGGITLLPSFVAAHGLEGHFGKRVTTHAAGFGGVFDEMTTRARSFTLGSTTFLEPLVSIPQGESGLSPPGLALENAGKELAGSIGNRILRHFILGFDYRRRRMMLEPYNHSPVPREIGNRAGFGVGCRANRCKVLYVIADSPAAEAGVTPGDVITALSGIRAGPALSQLVIHRAVERPPGTVLRLSLRHAHDVRDVSVVLRDFY